MTAAAVTLTGVPCMDVLAEELQLYSVENEEETVSFEYEIVDDQITITGLDGTVEPGAEIEIPEQIEGKTVSRIAGRAFYNCTAVKRISLPDTITGIGFRAFAGCTELESIDLPSSEPEMLNETLDTHGKLFSGCTSLKKIDIPSEWETIPSLMLSESCIESVDLSACEGMTVISADAFSDCRKLETIIFPQNVTRICRMAFANCKALRSITIPDTVSEIGFMAFSGCSNLESVKLPSSEPTMIKEMLDTHGKLFSGCTSLREIEIPENWKSIPDSIFAECGALSEIVIPSGVESIESKAFYQCSGLEKIYMNDVCRVSGDAFSKISDRANVYVKRKAPSIPVFIENDFVMNYGKEYLYPDSVLKSTGNTFTINRDRITSGMSCMFNVNYSCEAEVYPKLGDARVIVYIPSGMNYVNGNVYLNNRRTEATYDKDTRKLTVPASEASGAIRIPLIAQGSGEVQSYAALCYERDGAAESQIIDILQFMAPTLSLECAGQVSEGAVYVRGITEAGARVRLYCAETLAGTATANKLGEYHATVSLPGEGTYRIMAECEADPDIKAIRYVTYDKKNTSLTKFVFYYHNHAEGWVSTDLLSGGDAAVVIINPYDPVLFKLGFSDSSDLQSVFVVSTQNGVKKYLKAEKAENGEYVASGFFDPDDHGYIMGQLSVKYYRKAPTNNDSHDSGISIDKSRQEASDWINEATNGEYDFSTVEITNKKCETVEKEDGSTETVYSGDFEFDSGNVIHAKVRRRILSPEESRRLRREIEENVDGQYSTRYVGGRKIVTRTNRSTGRVEWMPDTDGLEDAPMKVFDMMIEGADKLGDYLPIFDAAAEYLKHMRVELAGGDDSEHMKLIVEFIVSKIADALLDALDESVKDFTEYAKGMYDRIIGEEGAIQKALTYLFDPSGYVYEGVEDNRLEGVKASVYYKENLSDADSTLWNASDYGQVNPQFTDAYGEYAWDVPEGFWQVKYEKDGYETAYSEWMEVPPIRTGVNVCMISTELPSVENVYTDGEVITIIFSQYMKTSSLSGISITDTEGDMHTYHIREEGLARAVTLDLNEAVYGDGDAIHVVIPEGVKNYADKTMSEEYAEDVKIRKLPAFKEVDQVVLKYDESDVVDVPILNFSEGTEAEVTGFDPVGLEAEVQTEASSESARITLHGILPGSYTVTVRIKGTMVTRDIPVLVGDINDPIEDPENEPWLEHMIRKSDTEYILNLAVRQKYGLSELAKVKADGRKYKITETRADKKIAVMSTRGVISAKKTGTAHISLTKSGVTYDITVNVYAPHFVYADSGVRSYVINAGDAMMLDYEDCGLKPSFNIPLKQQKYAVVDEDTGEITALRRGKVKVSAVVGEGKLARKVTAKVIVYDPVISGRDYVKIGKTLKLKVVGGVKKTEWSVENGTGSAQIGSSGKIKGLEEGTVTVTAVNNGKTLKKEIRIIQ